MKCSKCGATVAPEQKFCNMCGSSLENMESNVVNTNQPMNNYQTPIQPQYNQYQPQLTKKSNNGLIIAIVAIVAVALIFTVYLLTSNRNEGNNNSNKNSNSSVPVTPVSSTTKVKYSGFVFEVPDDYLYEIENNGFVITDDKTWVANIKVGTGSYDTIKMNKSRLKASVESKGYQATEAVVKDYNGFELVTFEVTSNSVVHIFAYGKASSTKYFAIEAIARTNQADYTILDKIAPILKGATYEGETQSIDSSNIPDNVLIDATNGIS